MVIEFEQAVREPKLRQKYVERVDLEGFAQYVKRVKYISNKSRAYSKELYETCLMCTICPFDLILCGTNYLKSKIYVFESSFDSELIQQESDFLSCLIDHEGKHAEQYYEGSCVLSLSEIRQRLLDCENRLDEIESIDLERAILKARMETKAYEYQLNQVLANKRVVNPKFKEFIVIELMHYADVLLKQEQLKA